MNNITVDPYSRNWSWTHKILHSFRDLYKIVSKPQLKLSFLTMMIAFSFTTISAQVVINELQPNGSVELKNIGTTMVNVSGYWLCDFPAYETIANSNVLCGSMMMAPGSILVVDDFSFSSADGEMGLYTTGNFSSSTAMIDYVEWGSSGHQRSSVAQAAGIWTSGDFAPAFSGSLAYDGQGDASSDWSAGAPTLCEENTTPCAIDGGNLTGGPFTFCVDGLADNVSGITLAGNTGANSAWVITDDQGNILGLPPMPSVVDFDEAGPGVCLIWHLSYEDGLEGLEAGMNTSNLDGCYDLSNPITVTRNEPDGGTLEGGPFTFCVDGEPDMVSGITLDGNTGTNSAWVITDDQGNILGLPPMPGVVDFDEAGPGVCLIWHLSYEDGLEGLAAGMNTGNLDGCYDLSNAITVERLATADCNTSCTADGGNLTGGPFTFCVDGQADNVSGINLDGNTGTNSAWVVTDLDGNILGLPPMPSVVDFDGAGAGVCLIWHLSYEDGLEGLEAGMNANDLDGCYDLSNAITVTRNQPAGGTLEGGRYEFCVNDGEPDMVSGITLTGNSGTNSAWVVTDDLGNILGLPPMPGVVNFEGAGPGTCLIWHLSFEDGLVGAEVGLNANDLAGCYSLSNPIEVTRYEDGNCTDLCTINGGALEGGPFNFCVDSEPDMVSGITLDGNTGTNSAWVVTDLDGNILGLPPMPGVVDFDAAGAGVCLIWHLSFEDGLQGAEVGMNANDLNGCYDLSNPVTVYRNQPAGGTLEGGRYEFCVNDGEPDMVSGITLTGNSGTNSAWVVTDDQGNILGLPPMPGVVNFEGAGPGTCLIWHLSFEDGLVGAEVGLNANDLAGCHSLSNPIEVTRYEDGNCTDLCTINGGALEGGPFNFCVDSEPDMVSGITLDGNTGTNSAWVVTDLDGNILGLPPMPGVVDFDAAGAGVCLIWHLSFEDGLQGAEVGMNANDLDGCYDLSNPVTVYRNQPDGGTLEGGPFTFCVDGEPDMVSGITLNGNTGTNSAWVITDDQGNILGLPPMPGVVDFDAAGPGVCLIWHLSYEDGLEGLAAGMNANDLIGCYDLSNPITVERLTGSDCPNSCTADGGILEGGPFTFTVGDGQADMIPAGSITVANSNGDNFQWIVTDDSGNILGLPPMPGAVNFDGAGPGTCEIWYLRYDGSVTGLAAGENIADIDGACFDLSNNAVQVIRNTADGCPANGGELFGGPFTFTVGDGQADMIPAGSITVANSNGDNFQWIVTDDSGNILGLPPMPGVVNFDGAGPGTCEIWYLRYDGSVTGLAAGENIADIDGACFDLSNNAVQVIRNTADGCPANGGELFGGPFTFTVGDGQADMIPAGSITVANSNGDNFQWIVTDDSGNILGLPPMPGAVNFDGAGPGTCEIWYLRYDGSVTGLAAGENIADIDGACFDLSNNAVQVIRNTGANGVDLSLSMSVDDGFYDQYEEVEYTIIVRNDGDETATGVVVSNELPSGMVFTSASETQGEYELFFEEWYVGDLAPGQSETLELTLFTLTENVDITNFAQVVAQDQTDADSTPDNNSANSLSEDDEAASTIVPRSEGGSGGGEGSIDLELSMTADQSTFDQYENVAFTLTLTNNGADPATNVIVSAGLPDGMVYTSSNTSDGDYNLFFEEWTLDELGAGETATLRLNLFTLVENTSITNFVEVFSAGQDDVDSTPGNGNGNIPQEDDEAVVVLDFLDSLIDPTPGSGSQLATSKSMTAMVYPNPAVDVTNIMVTSTVNSAATVFVYDLAGRVLDQFSLELIEGASTYNYNIGSLQTGNYMIRIITDAGEQINQRFVKIGN